MRYVKDIYLSALAWKENHRDPKWIVKNSAIAEDIRLIERVERGEISSVFIGYAGWHKWLISLTS